MTTGRIAYSHRKLLHLDGIHNSGITRNLASLFESHVCDMCEMDVRCSDSAESRFHELLTTAKLEIDFLMLEARSYSVQTFLFPNVMY